MMAATGSTYEKTQFGAAVESAFDILGSVTRQRLSEYLDDKYEIDIKTATPSDVGRIHRAITDLFGRGAAELLIKQIMLETDRLGS